MENVLRLLIRSIAALAITGATMAPANAMDMELVNTPDYSQYHIVFKGEIKSGDYKKLEEIYLSPIKSFQDLAVFSFWTSAPIHLDSPGGNVAEALKMAELINKLSRTVVVTGTCASACSILFMAGASRSVTDTGRVGLHRIYFDPTYYKNVTMTKARQLYEKNEDVFKEQMLKFGLPQYLFEKMMRTPSDSMYWLSKSDIVNVGMWAPYMEERLIARCGARPTRYEGEYFEKWVKCMQETIGSAEQQTLMAYRKSKGLDPGSKWK